MPEKFKGKSIEDVVKSYQNVEQALGNKSNEVGELRKLTDQILLNQATATQQPAAPVDINNDVGFNDFVEDPRNAVNRVLDDNPRLKALEESVQARTNQLSRDALLKAHTDADQVVASPEFQSWLGESPVRTRMLQEAHVNSDVAVASDILDMFKSTRKAATDNAVDERDAIAKGDLKKATVEKGRRSTSTKPIYKRTELIQMKMYDPRRYEVMSPEINLAYAEGRVK